MRALLQPLASCTSDIVGSLFKMEDVITASLNETACCEAGRGNIVVALGTRGVCRGAGVLLVCAVSTSTVGYDVCDIADGNVQEPK